MARLSINISTPAAATTLVFGVLAIFLLPSCSSKSSLPSPQKKAQPAPEAPKEAPTAAAERMDERPPPPPLWPSKLPAAPHVVGIGDLHGDLAATRRAFQAAGAVDADGRWIGGELVVVQTGDQLDRGDDEVAIMDFLERVESEARAAGGKLVTLNGNHELMNVALDFRYVTPGGAAIFEEMSDVTPSRSGPVMSLPPQMRARGAAFEPGGPFALRVAQQNVVVQVGDTVFLHGGLTPEFARRGLDAINKAAYDWITGKQPGVPDVVTGAKSPTWSRDFSTDPPNCDMLGETLEILGAARMVVGHTVQKEGITSACDGRIWRIDVGMAKHYGGSVQVLSIKGDTVTVIDGRE